ncbi:MAG: hypothetical protein PF447_13860 [Spirochaetaceae bacterium]|nr:hypothetical protein [Spirochaetaceae bacterium]
MDLINDYRLDQGLNALFIEAPLNETARLYARKLLKEQSLHHRDAQGHGPIDRYREQGGTALRVGEILGTQQTEGSNAHMFQLWLESPTHKGQLDNTQWSCMGYSKIQNEIAQVQVVMFSNSLILNILQGDQLVFLPETSIFMKVQGQNELFEIDGDQYILSHSIDKFMLIEFLDIKHIRRNRIIISPEIN